MAVNKDEILDAISKLTLVEVVELISDFEKKFGVTAAAPVAVANHRRRDSVTRWRIADHRSCQFVDRQSDGPAFLSTMIDIHCLKNSI